MQHPSVRFAASLAILFVGCAQYTTNEDRAPGTRPPDLKTSVTACGVCTGATPVCDMKTKRCVGCIADGDCKAPARCRGTFCVPGCDARNGCDAGVCNVDAGVCASCSGDADCKDPKNPYCDRPTGRCLACSPANDRCPPGEYCGESGGKSGCLPGCKNDDECRANGGLESRCCDHNCTDTSFDDMHCGACKAACLPGSTCCVSQCLDTSSDPFNCGACNRACSVNHADAACANGACTISRCHNDFGDCDKNPNNGCEADFDDDSDNCGRCGKSCVFACLGGSCIPF